MLNTHFDVSLYNGLPLVFAADAAVKSNEKFDDFLRVAGALIVEAGLANIAGVFLLHRHNVLKEENLMLEEYGWFRQEPALITHPANANKYGKIATPTRWAIVDSTYIPVEYSIDEDLHANFETLSRNRDFLNKYANAVAKYGFAGNLGLCIFDRDYFHQDRAGNILVEESSLEEESNIVFWTKRENYTNNLIETVWHFASDVSGPDCVPLCSQYCAQYSPGHAIEHYPNHGIIA